MTCAGCQYKVQTLLLQVSGVQAVNISLDEGSADITMDHHIPLETLKDALKDYPKYQITESAHIVQPAITIPDDQQKSWLATYKPILLIFGYILIVSFIAGRQTSTITAMRIFMSGFFLVFSFFKMLDLAAFADSYAMYDIVAKKIKAWGYIYAFIELSLGLAYALNWQPQIVNIITLVVMTVSLIGVLQSVLNKRQIRCACLGAVFNLPMSTVTIFEDALMIAMSALMLAL